MLVCCEKIFNDTSLYGDFLTQLLSSIWTFTKAPHQYRLYTESDPGQARRFLFIFEQYYRTSNEGKRIEMGPTCLGLKYAELALHKIGGLALTGMAFCVAVPIGFMIKTVHYTALSILQKKAQTA